MDQCSKITTAVQTRWASNASHAVIPRDNESHYRWNRCRLHFANASDINRRGPEHRSEPFDCFGPATGAYRNTLLLSGGDVEFDASARSLRMLAARGCCEDARVGASGERALALRDLATLLR